MAIIPAEILAHESEGGIVPPPRLTNSSGWRQNKSFRHFTLNMDIASFGGLSLDNGPQVFDSNLTHRSIIVTDKIKCLFYRVDYKCAITSTRFAFYALRIGMWRTLNILKSWLKNCALRKGNLILLFPPPFCQRTYLMHILQINAKKIADCSW